MTEMIDANFEIKIVAIAAEGLTKDFLGKTIDKPLLEKLKQLHKKIGLHIAAEGGEYETFVTNCPLFKKKIEILEAETNMENENTGQFVIKKVKLTNTHP